MKDFIKILCFIIAFIAPISAANAATSLVKTLTRSQRLQYEDLLYRFETSLSGKPLSTCKPTDKCPTMRFVDLLCSVDAKGEYLGNCTVQLSIEDIEQTTDARINWHRTAYCSFQPQNITVKSFLILGRSQNSDLFKLPLRDGKDLGQRLAECW